MTVTMPVYQKDINYRNVLNIPTQPTIIMVYPHTSPLLALNAQYAHKYLIYFTREHLREIIERNPLDQ